MSENIGEIEEVQRWIINLMKFHPYFSILSFLINSIHLLILSQKPMRTLSSTNVIMIGIALSNIYVLLCSIVPFIREKIENEDECQLPDSYKLVFLSWVASSFEDDFRRCDALLGIGMAFIRVWVLMKPNMDTSDRINDISGSLFGWKTNIGVFLFSSSISIYQHLRNTIGVGYMWFPYFDFRCQETIPVNYTQPVYDIVPSELNQLYTLSKIYVYVDGIVSKLAPAILFPILTILLIRQLRKIADSHAKMMSNSKQQQSTRTTKLIMFTAIAYMISLLPIGLVYVIQPLCQDAYCSAQAVNLGLVAKVLLTVTATVHFPICYFLSTPYRNTVKSILGVGVRKNNPPKSKGISQSSISTSSNGKI